MLSPSENVRRILVADDDLAFQVLMEHALDQRGFEVVCVDDGEQALLSALDLPPDLIFLDNVMPGMTGSETCRQLRKEFGDACPPVVMITGCDGEREIAEAFAAGAADYLVKPVNWSLLQHRLVQWLGVPAADAEILPAAEHHRSELLVSRKGHILEVIQPGELQVDGSESAVHTTLFDLVTEPVGSSILSLIKSVLRSRESRTECFVTDIGGRHADWQFQIEARGRDKVSIRIHRHVDEQHSRAELFRMAYVESSTGLPNQHLFTLTLKDRIIKARFRQRQLAVLCFAYTQITEIDVADPATSELLAEASRAINDVLCQDSRIARLDVPDSAPLCISGLDNRHFLVLVDGTAAQATITEILAAAAGAVTSSDSRLALGVGAAVFPSDGQSAELLIEAAHAAARACAVEGVDLRLADANSIASMCDSDEDAEAELLSALQNSQIKIYYQPRLDLESGGVVAAEALVRWPHPLLGMISGAGVFSRLASGEATRQLSDWALRAACQQARAWRDLGHKHKTTINLCREQVICEDFADRVLAALAEFGLAADAIELEIANDLVDSNRRVQSQFTELRQAGVGLIIDDFGDGTISLDALRKLSPHGVKIANDRAPAEVDGSSGTGTYLITRAIATDLGAVMIAKNIESAAELELARVRGCDQAQGFHLCQPLPATSLEDYLAELALGRTSSLDIAATI